MESVISNPQKPASVALLVFKFASHPALRGCESFLITII
jgi:hypothetical protein